MITNDIIEIEKDSTYTFSVFKENKNTAVIPSSATIIITDSSGNIILSSTAMSIDGTTGLCTYAWDSTGKDIGLNYIVKFNIDSDNTIIRLFDIYLYPFTNKVTDDDLILEYEEIKNGTWEAAGEAQSGTTTTLIDTSRYEDDNYWKGGVIEVFIGDTISQRKITGFVNSTNTITFSPALSTAVTTNKYTLRKSYQDQINYCGNKVCLDFKKVNKRASLILDNNAIKYLIVYKFFEEYFFKLSKSQDDEYYLKYLKYSGLYKSEFEGLSLVYDKDGDGIIEDGETDEKIGQIKWYR